MSYRNFEFIYDLLNASALGIFQVLKDSSKRFQTELESKIVDDDGWENVQVEIFMFLILEIDYEMYGFQQKNEIRKALLSYLIDRIINDLRLDSVNNSFKKVLHSDRPIINKLELIPVKIDFETILYQRMSEYGHVFEEYSKNKDVKILTRPFLQNIMWTIHEKAILDWEEFEYKPLFLDIVENLSIETAYLRYGYKFQISLYIFIKNVVEDNDDFTELNNDEMEEREESTLVELKKIITE